jgi:hypothetical protein
MEDTVKIFGFMLVKNEADIIAQTLTSLRSLGGFSHIFIFDNGSTDDTLAIARSFVGPDLSVESLPDAIQRQPQVRDGVSAPLSDRGW